MSRSAETIDIVSGPLRARFLREERGWRPEWIRERRIPLLRFKDHEWLSLGRVVTMTHAARARRAGPGWVFSGREEVLGCPVAWSVAVAPHEQGFLRIRSEIRPHEPIELVEALTTFETPYAYDGTEVSETLIGANPATVWHGRELKTAHYWRNPAWCYRRQEAACHTLESHLPVLVHRVRNADGSRQICTSLCANFDHCDYHDLFAQPTRTVHKDSPDYDDMKRADRRGYKFVVGAVNWSSAYVKDPNILVTPAGLRQDVAVSVATATPGGTLDAWLIRCWGVSNRLHGNDGSRLPVSRVYRRAGASWKKAGAWLQRSLAHPGSTAMVDPDKGPQDYVIGTRPLANWCYGDIWNIYLQRGVLPTLYYRAHVLGQRGELDALAALERRMLEQKLVTDPGDPALPTDCRPTYEALARLTPDSVIAARTPSPPARGLRERIAAVMADPDLPPGVQVRRLHALSHAMTRRTFGPLWRRPLDAIAA